jgi:uncharacterized protein (DUF1697 family)
VNGVANSTVFISLLRGINVGGNNKLKMAEIRKLYASLGFRDVQSYIQSGNLVFRADAGIDVGVLAEAIEDQISADYFGIEPPAMVMSALEVQRLMDESPFTGQQVEQTMIVFLSGVGSGEWAEQAKKNLVGDEQLAVTAETAYLYAPNGLGRSKAANSLLSKPPTGIKATMRNRRTLDKLLEMASSLAEED